MSSELMTVDFYGDKLFLANKEGAPYVPVKPIVENMGLDWKSQYEKIRANEGRWSMVIIPIVAEDGKMREMVCIKLSKMPGFLYSIDARKVKPALREKVLLYQEECDGVLWDYWAKGYAINPRSINIENVAALIMLKDALLEEKSRHLEDKQRIIDLQDRLYAKYRYKKWSKEEKAKARQMGSEGMDYKEVAKVIGANQSTMHNWFKKWGLPVPSDKN